MPKTFKEQVDDYFTLKYPILESTTTKIIKKHNRTLEASNVLSHTYLYILEKEPEIIHFSRTFTKSLEHTIYSFTLRQINASITFSESELNRMENKIFNRAEPLESIECQKITHYKHNIYNDEFIEDFYKSLSKVDAIIFKAYYYDGVDSDIDIALKFGISKSSAYLTIRKLKEKLKIYIQKNKIE